MCIRDRCWLLYVYTHTLLDISFAPPKFCLHSNGAHAVSFNSTVTSYGLFKSLFSQLHNTLSFESETTHLRSRGHGKEKVHFFIAAILGRKWDEYRNDFYTIVLKMFWSSIWHPDQENRIRGSGEIHHLNWPFFAAAARPMVDMQLGFPSPGSVPRGHSPGRGSRVPGE